MARLAIVAYSCEPGKGSEPGVAWDFIAHMAERGHVITVFTKADKREVIRASPLTRQVDFRFVNSPDIPLKGKFSVCRLVHYYLWQFSCLRYFRTHFRRSDFDLVHHVTFVNDWTPSAGAFFGLPFILGPVGRHPAVPLNYLFSLPSKRPLLAEIARSTMRLLAGAFDPFTRATHRRAAKIVVIDAQLIRHRFRDKTIVLPAICIDPAALPQFEHKAETTTKLYWTGNFTYWKGPELAIRAFISAREQCPYLELHMFGDGPDRASLMKRYGVQPGLFFHGRIPQASLFREEASMDIFLYPSFEGGGMVVLEAMAMAKPVIGLTHGGLKLMVNDECGRLVQYVRFDEAISGLACAIRELAESPELARRLGLLGRARVAREFSIQSKCDFIERQVYGLPQN